MIKKRLIDLMVDSKKYIYYSVFFRWINLVLQILLIFILTDIIGSIYKNALNITTMEIEFISMIVLITIKYAADKKIVDFSFKSGLEVKRILRRKIYSKVLDFGCDFENHISKAKLSQLSTEAVESLEIYFSKYLPQFIYSLITPLTLFFILSFESFLASFFLLLCVPLIPLSIVLIQKFAKKLLRKYWGKYTSLSDSFLENLEGLVTLKIFNKDLQKEVQMDKEAENFRKITMKVLTMQLNSISVMDILAYSGSVLGIVIALSQFRNGLIELTSFLRIMLLSAEFFIPLRLLGSFFHIAMNGMSASDEIFEFLDHKTDEVGIEKLDSDILDINIGNLSYSYIDKDNNEIPALKAINMNLHTGKFYSIVGDSGSGKSTFANILSSKLRDYKGNITINGIELKDIDRNSKSYLINTVNSDSKLFEGSLRDNLKTANENLTDEKMNEVLNAVSLKAFFDELDGLDTFISEDSKNLSGGQKQRLFLARALLSDRPLIILDEATANIDVENEEKILNTLKKIKTRKLIVMITHKLTNVVDCDVIYLFKNGQTTSGLKHEKLYRDNPDYRNLFDEQHELERYAKGLK